MTILPHTLTVNTIKKISAIVEAYEMKSLNNVNNYSFVKAKMNGKEEIENLILSEDQDNKASAAFGIEFIKLGDSFAYRTFCAGTEPSGELRMIC